MSRSRKSSGISPMFLAGAAALGYVGMRALLGLKPGADDGFFNWQGPSAKGVDVGSAKVDLPIRYYRDDSFMAIFSAAYEPVRAALPSSDLYPVTLPNGRATLAVIAFNYLETSIGPYGEVGIAIPCTYQRQAPPLLPLVLEERFPNWGGFVLHLPVTTRVARDGGRAIYGYTKFLSDMDFEKRPAYQRVRLSEGDEHILTLTVRQGGLLLKDNRSIVTYSVLGNHLLRTTIPCRAVLQVGLGTGAGHLQLGDHAIADQLREMDVSPEALVAKNYLSRYGILPAGEPVGIVERTHTGHIGRDIDYGRLTVSYARGELINMHPVPLED